MRRPLITSTWPTRTRGRRSPMRSSTPSGAPMRSSTTPGSSGRHRCSDSTYEDLRRSLDVNVGGTFLGMKTFLDLHVRSGTQRPGSIVNISSVRGLIGAARNDHVQRQQVRGPRLDEGGGGRARPARHPRQRRLPGSRSRATCRSGIRSSTGLDWSSYVAQLPLGRIGRPADVGETVAWLASDASAFVTGIDVPVDGGLTATSYSVVPTSDLAAAANAGVPSA